MRYIRTHIERILGAYTGSLPLTHFLKEYYKSHPILGSRDRKILSEMAYAWYRCSKAIVPETISPDEKINACLFLCSRNPQLISPYLPPQWEPACAAGTGHKLELLKEHGISLNFELLFSENTSLSDPLLREDWLMNMLQQPALFVNILKQEKELLALLQEHNVAYKKISDKCYSLPNATPIDKWWPADAYLVQDASSQLAATYAKPGKNEYWLDCCAGAGGKSLQLMTQASGIKLTVSDVRKTILHNLQKRFALYQRKQPEIICTDWTKSKETHKAMVKKQFDGIICDVPCSGSGTWARTPEEMYFYTQETLEKLLPMQFEIAKNAQQYLKPGGRMVYITCSVFRQENEAQVTKLIKDCHLQLEEQHVINGIEMHADCMFVAVLRKP